MEVMSAMGAIVLIVAVLAAVFAFDYARGQGWGVGSRSL